MKKRKKANGKKDEVVCVAKKKAGAINLDRIAQLPEDMSPGELYSAILSLVVDGAISLGVAAGLDFDYILEQRDKMRKQSYEEKVKTAICDALSGKL